MKKKKPAKIQKKQWVQISLLLLAVVLLGATLRHHMQTSAQNKNFQETQTWLRSVMDEVAAEIPGGKRVGFAYCDRQNLKFAQGARSCVVNENILYPIGMDVTDATALKAQSLIKVKVNTSVEQTSSEYGFNKIYSYSFTKGTLSCYIEYYDLRGTTSYSHLAEISNFTNGLRVSMSCSGDAMADYFPSVE